MSQHFTLGGQSIGVSASTSVLPVNTQDWSPRNPGKMVGTERGDQGSDRLKLQSQTTS